MKWKKNSIFLDKFESLQAKDEMVCAWGSKGQTVLRPCPLNASRFLKRLSSHPILSCPPSAQWAFITQPAGGWGWGGGCLPPEVFSDQPSHIPLPDRIFISLCELTVVYPCVLFWDSGQEPSGPPPEETLGAGGASSPSPSASASSTQSGSQQKAGHQ